MNSDQFMIIVLISICVQGCAGAAGAGQGQAQDREKESCFKNANDVYKKLAAVRPSQVETQISFFLVLKILKDRKHITRNLF